MNRHVENDPVYELFVNRPDCLHIHIDYFENPFCPEALKVEAEECKKRSLTDYNHIWLGEPLSQSEDVVFAKSDILAVKAFPLRPGYNMKIAGFDIARYGDDKCAAVIIQQADSLRWEVIHVEEWENRDLNYTTGRILSIANSHDVEKCIIDEDGIGAGPLDSLQHGRGEDRFTGFRNPTLNYEKHKNFANPRTENTYKLKDMVLKGHILIQNEDLIRELCSLRFSFDHHQRHILISKDKMRKEGVKSPNIADCLIYAVSLIEEVKESQERRYFHHPGYSKEDDLWKIAGIR